jgi:hypothetical protein
LERNLSQNSVIIFKKYINNKYTVGPVVSTAEHKLTSWNKFLFGELNTNYSGEITQKEPLLVPNTIYFIITKSQKNRGIVAKLRNFVVELAEKLCQDLATVSFPEGPRTPWKFNEEFKSLYPNPHVISFTKQSLALR